MNVFRIRVQFPSFVNKIIFLFAERVEELGREKLSFLRFIWFFEKFSFFLSIKESGRKKLFDEFAFCESFRQNIRIVQSFRKIAIMKKDKYPR